MQNVYPIYTSLKHSYILEVPQYQNLIEIPAFLWLALRVVSQKAPKRSTLVPRRRRKEEGHVSKTDIEPLHRATQIGLRSFEDQMAMVRHEAVGVDPNRKLPAHSLQAGKKTLAIIIIVNNCILALPTIHNVVKRTRIFNA